MSGEPPALDQLEMYADESIGATYGTLSASLVAQLVSVARDDRATELAAAERRGAVRALREAADHLVDSIVALRADNPVDLCYINCTMIDVREMRGRADKLEDDS